MKRITAILFLLLFIYQLSGYFLVHVIQQNQIRKEVKQKIKCIAPEDELVIFHFSIIESYKIDWTKKGKEFRFEKEMYDVVKIEYQGDSVTYKCIHDFKESQLFSMLDKHIQDYMATDSNKNKTTKLLSKISFDYQITDTSIPDNHLYFNHKLVDLYLNTYSSLSLSIESPPPKTNFKI